MGEALSVDVHDSNLQTDANTCQDYEGQLGYAMKCSYCAVTNGTGLRHGDDKAVVHLSGLEGEDVINKGPEGRNRDTTVGLNDNALDLP